MVQVAMAPTMRVEDNEEATEERDVSAGGTRAEEVQSAYNGGGEDAETDHCAELQKDTQKHASAVVLKIRNDDGGGLPRAGPVGLRVHAGDGIEPGTEQHRIEDGEHAGMRTLVDSRGRCGGFDLRVHAFPLAARFAIMRMRCARECGARVR